MSRIALIVACLLLQTCSFTQQVHDGRTAVDRKQYSLAVKLLPKEMDRAKTRSEKGQLAFLLAQAYQELHQPQRAIDYFQLAYDNGFGVDALKELAFALKEAERYVDAKEAFKNLGIEIGSPYEYRREISACDLAIGWKKITTPAYTVAALPFNSSAADYAAVQYPNNQLVVTSDRSSATGDDTYTWTGNHFSDLFLVNLDDNSVSNFNPQLNSPDNEGTITFTADFKQAVFTRCSGPKKEDAFCQLMITEATTTGWSAPRPLPFQQAGINYGQPSLSADGRQLYFSCNHPDGWGGFDIYVVDREDGSWGEPRLLSRAVNTIGNEQFPFIDGDTLYFSSDFLPGMGGLDVFRTYRQANGDWAPAINLLPPVNSGADDFSFIIDYQANSRDPKVLASGFFTSNRPEDGSGNDDIYRFERREVPPPPPPPPTDKPIVYKMLLDVYILEKIFSDPSDPNSRVLGRRPIPGASLEIRVGGKSQTATADPEGKIRIELSPETDYQFLASQPNYLNNQGAFTSKGIGRDPQNPEQLFELEIVLDKIFLNREIVLENIYYDFDKWDIRDDAKPTLDALANNLRINPNIRIQLASHTDCRGNDNYNLTLSQRRAQAAVDYLIAKGIGPDRVEARGYGETVPADDCLCARCTEEEHQKNRRTAFKIVE